MIIIWQVLAASVAAGSFAVIYRVPQREVLPASTVGGLGWLVYSCLRMYLNPVIAMLCGATSVTIGSELWARRRRQPSTLFLIPGMIPLVPGGQAYETMLSFLQGNYLTGVEQLTITLFLSGAIAGGILIVSSLFRFYHHRH